MANNDERLFLAVPSGYVVSNYVAIANVDGIGSVWIPAVTSCQMFLQGSWDTTSANFHRIQNTIGTSTFCMLAADGSKVFPVLSANIGMPYVRLESSVTQTDTRTCVGIVIL